MNTSAHKTINALLTLLLVSFSGYLHAGSPVWTFLPLTPTSISVSSSDIATIQYQVTNQSKKSHTLEMKAISGISQNTTLGNCANPFTLGYQQSCILTLTIDGSAIQGGIDGGPVVCQQGNALQCYQPSSADALSIRLMTAPGATTLSASVSTLGLSVNCQLSGGCPPRTPTQNIALTGTPRLITITNTGSYAATDVTYSPSPALPGGTTISPANCGTIAASSSCVLTITPGNTPSSAPGNTNPTPITLSISGTNTNTLTPMLNILTYGSVYQGGYVYAVNDNTPNTGSIGGTVVTQTDQASISPDGVVWSSNGASSTNVSYDSIPGIAENSTTSVSVPTYMNAESSFNSTYINESMFPFPSFSSFFSCNGGTSGACNSSNILAFYNSYVTNYGNGASPYTLSAGPTMASYYAAGLCTATISDYSDWYLPAICEMGPVSNGSGCSTSTQNIVSNLPDLLGDPNISPQSTSCLYGANCLVGSYWSSTDFSDVLTINAWYQDFITGVSVQGAADKALRFGVRCSRALTL